jgi:hypothetical protein
VSLDNCGFDFTTEAHRVARRQYAVVDTSGRMQGISNELVAYDTAEQANLALAQWHRAAANCPRTAVRSALIATPTLKEHVTRNVHVTRLPNPANTLTIESIEAPGQGTYYDIGVLQVRGRILDAIWVNLRRPPTAREIRADVGAAAVTGRRLLDLG